MKRLKQLTTTFALFVLSAGTANAHEGHATAAPHWTDLWLALTAVLTLPIFLALLSRRRRTRKDDTT
ncbi:MAG: hypothetical protein MPK06_04110 [Alphaproteobacteria bacterium]|nr:hypothetical protein [Alphaproteobacteria bacterium]MDA7982598.1 hypothetical protein [Alphaproteobacteria bacterium]MDA7984192.1 hypothetical protein [Alphaproteobacteria bacterium]MDA7987250.1 hypothetical protein [Alphaproteobacteria bacterium]MDA7988363.1 hypothetical protein [Alphaproteobacteria bacterium]